jgi:hypothetical protein
MLDGLLRVELLDNEGNVRVCGVGSVPRPFSSYIGVANIKDLPESMRDKLAVLWMRDPTPPTELVEGIGRRIDEKTFWVLVVEE